MLLMEALKALLPIGIPGKAEHGRHWSPSKSALNAVQTKGCIFMDLPSSKG